MTAPQFALLLHAPDGGGPQRRTLALAGALAAEGLGVTLLLIEPDGALKLAIPPDIAVEVLGGVLPRAAWARRSPGRQCAAAVPALAGWLRRSRPALLMAAAPPAHVPALAAHALAGAPCPLVLRAPTAPSGGLLSWSPWLLGRADAVVAESEFTAAELRRRAPLAHVVTLPAPVVEADFPSRMTAPPPHSWLADGSPVVLACGRLEGDNDFAGLIRACARIGARLIILGDGGDRARLTALADVLRVPLQLPGFVAEPLPWMARASVFASMSPQDGTPDALIEAMACGCPVVAIQTPDGGADLIDGLGPLVPLGDDRGLADVLAHVIRHQPPRAALVRRAQSRSVANAAQAYARLFHGLMARPPVNGAGADLDAGTPPPHIQSMKRR